MHTYVLLVEVECIFSCVGGIHTNSSNILVDPSVRVDRICNSLINGKRLLVVGPRDSGKTTLLNFTIKKLENDYACLRMSGQLLHCPSGDTVDFWHRLNSSIYWNCFHSFVSDSDKNTVEYFEDLIDHMRIRDGKPIILLLDSMNAFRGEIKQQFFKAIYKLSQQRRLHAFYGTGLYGSLMSKEDMQNIDVLENLTKMNDIYESELTPFLYFDKNEIKSMFYQWIINRKLDKQENIDTLLDELCDITMDYSLGQAGLVSRTGVYLDEKNVNGCHDGKGNLVKSQHDIVASLQHEEYFRFMESSIHVPMYSAITDFFTNHLSEDEQELVKNVFAYLSSNTDRLDVKSLISDCDENKKDKILTLCQKLTDLGFFRILSAAADISEETFTMIKSSKMADKAILDGLLASKMVQFPIQLRYFDYIENDKFKMDKYIEQLIKQTNFQAFMNGPMQKNITTNEESIGRKKMYADEATISDWVRYSLRYTICKTPFVEMGSYVRQSLIEVNSSIDLNSSHGCSCKKIANCEKTVIEVASAADNFAQRLLKLLEHIDEINVDEGQENNIMIKDAYLVNVDQTTIETITNDNSGIEANYQDIAMLDGKNWTDIIKKDDNIFCHFESRNIYPSFEEIKNSEHWKKCCHLAPPEVDIHVINILTTMSWDIVIMITDGEVQVVKDITCDDIDFDLIDCLVELTKLTESELFDMVLKYRGKLLQNINVEQLNGVGKITAEKLIEQNIVTINDLVSFAEMNHYNKDSLKFVRKVKHMLRNLNNCKKLLHQMFV